MATILFDNHRITPRGARMPPRAWSFRFPGSVPQKMSAAYTRGAAALLWRHNMDPRTPKREKWGICAALNAYISTRMASIRWYQWAHDKSDQPDLALARLISEHILNNIAYITAPAKLLTSHAQWTSMYPKKYPRDALWYGPPHIAANTETRCSILLLAAELYDLGDLR